MAERNSLNRIHEVGVHECEDDTGFRQFLSHGLRSGHRKHAWIDSDLLALLQHAAQMLLDRRYTRLSRPIEFDTATLEFLLRLEKIPTIGP